MVMLEKFYNSVLQPGAGIQYEADWLLISQADTTGERDVATHYHTWSTGMLRLPRCILIVADSVVYYLNSKHYLNTI